MKIEMRYIEEITIEEFADRHDLTMTIVERDPQYFCAYSSFRGHRFYAAFKGAEVKDGALLYGRFGDGDTPEDAIQAYARAISMKRLVIDARTQGRRELTVPRLTAENRL